MCVDFVVQSSFLWNLSEFVLEIIRPKPDYQVSQKLNISTFNPFQHK